MRSERQISNTYRCGIASPTCSSHAHHGNFSFYRFRQQQGLVTDIIDPIKYAIKILRQNFRSIARGKKLLNHTNSALSINSAETLLQHLNFRPPNFTRQCRQLPIHIAHAHFIQIDQHQCSDSRSRQRFHRPRTNPAYSNHADMRRTQPLRTHSPIKPRNSAEPLRIITLDTHAHRRENSTPSTAM